MLLRGSSHALLSQNSSDIRVPGQSLPASLEKLNGRSPAAPSHRVCPPTAHWVAVGPQEAPTAAQGRTSRVHRPQGGGGRTPRDHRRSGRDSTELRPQTWVFGPGGGRGGWGTGGRTSPKEGGARRRSMPAARPRLKGPCPSRHVLKKGTAKKLRACDKTAHQQYRKAGLQARFVGATSVSRPRWSGAAPRRSASHWE